MTTVQERENGVEGLIECMDSSLSLSGKDYLSSLVEEIRVCGDEQVRLELLKSVRRSLLVPVEVGESGIEGGSLNFAGSSNFPVSSNFAGSSNFPVFSSFPVSSSTVFSSNATEKLRVGISIDKLLESDLLAVLYDILLSSAYLRVQTEVLFIFHRLSYGTPAQVHNLVQSRIVQRLVCVLPLAKREGHCTKEFRHALCATLKNILNSSIEARRIVFATKTLLPSVLQIAAHQYDLVGLGLVLAILTGEEHALKNELESKGTVVSVPYEGLVGIGEFLRALLKTSEEVDVLVGGCSGCKTIADRYQSASLLFDLEIVNAFLPLLGHPVDAVAFGALAVIARLAYVGTTAQIDRLIDLNIVPLLLSLFEGCCPSNPGSHKFVSPGTKARICNCLGNIGCESPVQVNVLIDEDVFPFLIKVFRTDGDYNTRIEAAYAVSAAVSRANLTQVAYIVSCDNLVPLGGDEFLTYSTESNCMLLIADMLELVRASDPASPGSVKLCNALLRALANILYMGIEEAKREKLFDNPYTVMFLSCQGHIKLREMLFYPDYNIVTKTQQILTQFFST